MQIRQWRWTVAALSGIVMSCGGDGGGDSTAPPGGTVASIEITPTPLNLLVGGTGGLTAVARDGSGAIMAQTAFTWASVTASIASVTGSSNVGAVIGLVPGTTQVTAKMGAITGTAVVNVQQPTLTLQVVPQTASTTVGGTVSFSVVAKDANGVTQPAPAVTSWTSSSQTVATITAAGVATGRAVGATQIGAIAGTLVATPAVLAVTAAPAAACDNIASIVSWNASLSWNYARQLTNSENHRIAVEHAVAVTTTLNRDVGAGSFIRYSASPGGTASINDSDTNLNGTSPSTSTLKGGGPIATTTFGIPLPGLMVEIDLTNCTYRFEVPVQLSMTLVRPGNAAETGVLPLGVLRSAFMPVGPWRQLGLSDLGGPNFLGHSVAWAPNPPVPTDTYTPFGFGQLLFVGKVGPNETPEGAASGTWAFTVK